MDLVEKIYSVIFGGIFLVLIIYRTANGLSPILSTYCRRFFLANLVHPISHRGFWSWLPSPLHLIFMVLYSVGTGVCNVIGVQSFPEAGSRAARLSLMNLMPLFLSGGYEFGARLLSMSLATYGAVHRTIGVMAAVQTAIHVGIRARERSNLVADNGQFYGILVKSPISLIYISADKIALTGIKHDSFTRLSAFGKEEGV